MMLLRADAMSLIIPRAARGRIQAAGQVGTLVQGTGLRGSRICKDIFLNKDYLYMLMSRHRTGYPNTSPRPCGYVFIIPDGL